MAPAAQLRFTRAPASGRRESRTSPVPRRLVVCVLLPFATGFHLSYLLRTINALIAGPLGNELGIGPAELGLLTSAYFLAFGSAQIPCGILLDRYGPKLVQSALLLIASAGSVLFAVADNLALLLIGRALIGLGVAAGLMAGLKASVLWFPADRQALVNGWMMMLGTLGAVTATAPAELLIDSIGWRGLFAAMGGLSALTALLVLILVPEQEPSREVVRAGPPITMKSIFAEPRFWRIAPLSALGIGTSWALQGLWTAPWLRDVDGLERSTVVGHLGAMALVLSVSGLTLGLAADRLRRIGIRTEFVLASTLALSLAAQIALVVDWALPPIVLWSLISVAGVATVLGYTVLGEIFPKQASGRANGALNLLQVAAAFAVQSVFGAIVSLWEADAGRYPAEAYRTALVFFIGLQLVAFGWFATARRCPVHHPTQQAHPRDAARIKYRHAAGAWIGHISHTRHEIVAWRSVAIGSMAVLGVVGAAASIATEEWSPVRSEPSALSSTAPQERAVPIPWKVLVSHR